MGKVVSFNKPKIDDKTVEVLEDLLKEAKTGELISILYVDRNSDGGISFGWAGTPTDEMIAKLERIKFAYFYDTEIDY